MLITPARVGMLLTADTPGTYEIPIYSPSESSTVKAAIKREQSQARLSYAEREQARSEASTLNPRGRRQRACRSVGRYTCSLDQ